MFTQQNYKKIENEIVSKVLLAWKNWNHLQYYKTGFVGNQLSVLEIIIIYFYFLSTGVFIII